MFLIYLFINSLVCFLFFPMRCCILQLDPNIYLFVFSWSSLFIYTPIIFTIQLSQSISKIIISVFLLFYFINNTVKPLPFIFYTYLVVVLMDIYGWTEERIIMALKYGELAENLRKVDSDIIIFLSFISLKSHPPPLFLAIKLQKRFFCIV